MLRWFLATVAVIGMVAAAGLGWFVFGPTFSPALATDWMPVVGVLAGDGVAGFRDGAGSVARFSDPFGISAAPNGDLIVADAGEAQRIRRISGDGVVSTVAGGAHGHADGVAARV